MKPIGPIRIGSGDHVTGLTIVGEGGPAVRVEPGATGWSITDCVIRAPAPKDGRAEPWRAVGIAIDGGGDFAIERCTFADCASSIYAAGCTGNAVVRGNTSSGVRGPVPRGQFLQLDHCVGQWTIEGNQSSGGPGVEDHINAFNSRGLSALQHIRIADNVLTGGSGSESGSGICVGDGPGGGFVVIAGNRIALVNNAGIGIAGGAGYVVENNLVYQWGASRESATSAVLVVRKEASEVRSKGNRGIARSWVHGGNGEIGAGYWVEEGGPSSVVSIDDKWQDRTLTLADVIGDMEMPTDKPIDPQRAADIARDACLLFADRYTVATKNDAAVKGVRECVALAQLARELSESSTYKG